MLWAHLALLHRVFLTVTDNCIFLNLRVQMHCNMWFPANSLAKDYVSASLWDDTSNLEHPDPMNWNHGLLPNKGELLSHLIFPDD